MFWYLEVLRKYWEFNGRARRKEYWWFQLINLVIVFFIALLDVAAGMGSRSLGLLLLVYSLATLVPSLAVSVRRLHDTGRSGWWWLISLVPFGALVLLIFCVLDSDPGPNEYGPNPKAKEAYAAAPYGSYGAKAMAQGASRGTASPSTHAYYSFCANCGTPLRAGIRTCSHCGKPAW